MLRLRIAAPPKREDVKLDEFRAGSAEDWVERFHSIHVQISSAWRADRWEVWVGEVPDPFVAAQTAPVIDQYCRLDGFEGAKIVVAGVDGTLSIDVARTAVGSTPFYVALDEGAFVASWRFEDVASLPCCRRPEVEACRIYLKHGPTLSRNQILAGVYMLWPGESVRVAGGTLQFHEQPSPQIALPSIIFDDARATDEFVRIVGETLSESLARSRRSLLEISGGYDSSCVAIAAFQRKAGLSSYGLIHEGAVGAQQMNRRRELTSLLSADDFEFPSYEYTPFRALSFDECTVTPMDDNHRLSCVKAIDAHPTGGFDLIVTGMGGDELTRDNAYSRREFEVAGSVASSAIVGSVGRADMFMRRGLWPKNPLAAPPVVDFCRRLPAPLRLSRMLHVLTLARAGLSDGFIFPRYSEHYGHAMQREASLIDFDHMLGDSIVADYGIADISGLLARAREASYGGFSYELIGELWTLLKLEAVLKRYVS